ncbi:MAG: hypothetical protein HOZ81_05025 [Streptomyces sp.]|nr:hypothetical protein [Streptomyces sp.]
MTDTSPPTDQQLDDIEVRANVATDGPWERCEKYGPDFFACTSGAYLRGVGTFNFGDGTDADADEEFVKHAVQDVRKLVAEVRRQRSQIRFLRGALARKDARTGEGDQALREFLAAKPGPTVQRTGYLVSCLPEGHDDRWTFTVQVRHTGGGLFAVLHGIRHYAADGTWSYEPGFDDEDDTAELEWVAAHRFDHDTALRLAKEVAPTLTYRGRSVADALSASVRPVPAPEAPAPHMAAVAAADGRTGVPWDTPGAWLYQRFMPDGIGWDRLDDSDRAYWEHQAAAVRRAVARGGFKTTPAAVPAVVETGE